MTTTAATRQSLVNLEAEEAVIGALLVDPLALDDVGTLTANDFANERYRLVFSTIQAMRQAGRAVDLLTLTDELVAQDKLDTLGGQTFLAQAVLRVPTAIYISHYAAIVEHFAYRRRLARAAQEIATLAYDLAQDDTDVQAQGATVLSNALTVPAGTDLLTWQASFTAFNEAQLEENAAQHANQPTLSLPWQALDFVRPLQPGSFAIVAADSGVGKTVFMECCADVWARRGFQVAFFHSELMHREMLKRRVCRWANLTMREVDGAGLTNAMNEAERIAKTWPGAIHYVHCAGWRMGQVVSRARSMVRQGMAQVVILDYLQDLAMTEYVRGQTTADMRGGDAKLLKQFAEHDGVPVLAGSQFNRATGQAMPKTRHNLRDSAVYDQKASLVLTLERDVLKQPLYDANRMLIAAAGDMAPETIVRVDKQTFGKTGSDKIWTEGKRFLMVDIAQVNND